MRLCFFSTQQANQARAPRLIVDTIMVDAIGLGRHADDGHVPVFRHPTGEPFFQRIRFVPTLRDWWEFQRTIVDVGWRLSQEKSAASDCALAADAMLFIGIQLSRLIGAKHPNASWSDRWSANLFHTMNSSATQNINHQLQSFILINIISNLGP